MWKLMNRRSTVVLDIPAPEKLVPVAGDMGTLPVRD